MSVGRRLVVSSLVLVIALLGGCAQGRGSPQGGTPPANPAVGQTAPPPTATPTLTPTPNGTPPGTATPAPSADAFCNADRNAALGEARSVPDHEATTARSSAEDRAVVRVR